jgi:outer membrane translocation and assembly module TamA
VRVVVIEASKHHIEAGINYATDTGFGGLFNYTNQALFDSRGAFAARCAWTTRRRTWNSTSIRPAQPGGYWNSFLLRPIARPTIQNRAHHKEAVAGYTRNWGAETPPSAFILSANYEEESVSGGPFSDRYALYFGYRRTFRRTDDFISPRRGYLAMFELGGRPGRGGPRVRFVRGIASGSMFFPVRRDGDLCCAPRRVASSRRAATTSRAASCSAPAATRRCAATTT